MGEFAVVDAVADHWIDLFKEITFHLAIRALDRFFNLPMRVALGSYLPLCKPPQSLCPPALLVPLQLHPIFGHDLPQNIFIFSQLESTFELDLALLAIQLVASFALQRHVWELAAVYAEDLRN